MYWRACGWGGAPPPPAVPLSRAHRRLCVSLHLRRRLRHPTIGAKHRHLPSEETAFRVPPCKRCGGVLKPNVTFFGDIVPPDESRRAMDAIRSCDALLIVGTSLSTLSAFSLAEAAASDGTPLAVVIRGETRLERSPGVPHLKIEDGCGETLSRLAHDLLLIS